ncbi:hypothetical protein GNG26_10905 [Leclercia sp. J807]|uniref:hypothetical protein n=1 Tax=Leclercia sp. J807 TaxID=2681307 RepID=UPI0012E1F1DA|nr:hypothetical protein [Leclercia sp. J807]QGU10830.1 hypothetical protein GNG26_10905 [Leclercia sp. J807]
MSPLFRRVALRLPGLQNLQARASEAPPGAAGFDVESVFLPGGAALTRPTKPVGPRKQSAAGRLSSF